MGKKALLLGAGGPLGALEAGALMALHDNGVEFDVISGACIGSILALTYVSPAGNRTGREALELWINSASVSDYIYKVFPANFKIFQKDGSIFNDIWDKIYPNFFYNPFLSETGFEGSNPTNWNLFEVNKDKIQQVKNGAGPQVNLATILTVRLTGPIIIPDSLIKIVAFL